MTLRGASALASLLTDFVSIGCPGEKGDVAPQERGNRGRPESPPPGLEDATSKADEPGAIHGDAVPGSGFSRDFASLDEFLAFACTKVASTEVPLRLVDSTLSAREADLAAWEEAVRAHEKMQTAEDMILMGREVKVAE